MIISVVLIVRGHIILINIGCLPMRSKRRTQKTAVLRKLGKNIRAARRAKGMSQESLAFAAELDRSYVGGIERGERNVTIMNLKKIADAVVVPVHALTKGL